MSLSKCVEQEENVFVLFRNYSYSSGKVQLCYRWIFKPHEQFLTAMDSLGIQLKVIDGKRNSVGLTLQQLIVTQSFFPSHFSVESAFCVCQRICSLDTPKKIGLWWRRSLLLHIHLKESFRFTLLAICSTA